MLLIKDIKEGFKSFGWFELMFAFYPIISGYKYGNIPMHLFWLIILDILALFKKRNPYNNHVYTHVAWLFSFVIIHEILWFFVIKEIGAAQINSFIGLIIFLMSFFIITPVLDLRKLKAPLSVLTLICILGLLYHVYMVSKGHIIRQLSIPLLPAPTESRLLEEGLRPKSYFAEPAAYCSYMLIPLYLCLLGKKYFYAIVIIISMLLTTSTTGLYTSFTILGAYILSQPVKWARKILLLLAGIVIAMSLKHSIYFEETINQASNKELSKNERTSVGPLIIKQLTLDQILIGIPYQDVGDMYEDGQIYGNFMLLGDYNKQVIFVPTFWNLIFKYGIVALILYLMVYWDFLHNYQKLWPLVIVFIITMFSNPDMMGASYIYGLAFLFLIADSYDYEEEVEEEEETLGAVE